MTQITFERSGGFAGNEIDFDIKLDSLPENEARRLQKMIENADFFNVPTNIEQSAAPDQFLYRLTVDNGTEYHTVRFTEATMPKTLLPLVRELTMRNALIRKVTAR
jgi:hypothetical protein